MDRLRGRTVYLTGASHGIGRATARLLAGHHARLAICGRNESALQEVKKMIEAEGAPVAFSMRLDLADTESTLRFYREAKSFHGPPDILINNAGFNPRKATVQELTIEEFNSIIAVNLRAPFILMKEAAKDMAERKSGHIINVLSSACHYSIELLGAYTAAKKGLQGITDVFRKEVRRQGIRVSSIYPGGTDSNFRPETRPQYMRAESVAEAIIAAITLPEDLVVHQFTFRPMSEDNF
jgi:NAD(P)-dependent dehydrogenase (short-subunit alcohol dehydrogenase family)